MLFRNPFATAMANSIALTRALVGFRAALITRESSSVARTRRGLQTQRCLVVGERRIQIAWRTNCSGLCALPGLTRPVALVRDGRARVGRCRYRRQRQQE